MFRPYSSSATACNRTGCAAPNNRPGCAPQPGYRIGIAKDDKAHENCLAIQGEGIVGVWPIRQCDRFAIPKRHPQIPFDFAQAGVWQRSPRGPLIRMTVRVTAGLLLPDSGLWTC